MNALSFRDASRRVTTVALLCATTTLSSLAAAAGLPEMEDPSRGTGSGIVDTLKNYAYDIVLLISLLVVVSMFIGICYHAYGRFAEIHAGRGKWGDFGLTVAVGAILLVIGIWLLTKATEVL